MFDNLRRDTRRQRELKRKSFPWYVLESLLFENGYQAVVFYRIARWFRARNVPVLGPFFARWGLYCTGVDISPLAEIGPGLLIVHGVGLVIGGHARIGCDATILHQVTLGSPRPDRREAMPVIGDRVFLGAGAKVIGAVTVGDDVFVGVDAIVTQDIPDRCRVLSTATIQVVPQDPVSS